MMLKRAEAIEQYGEDAEERPSPAALIEAHMPAARRIAWHIHGKAPGSIEVEELVQIAMVALIEAANAHDGRADTFGGYASTRIRGSLLDEMRRRAAMSRGSLRRRRGLINARETLRARLGREAEDAEVAAHLGLDDLAYSQLRDEVQGIRYSSMDEVYSDHSAWFAADQEDAFENLSRTQLIEAVSGIVAELPERQALVLQLYFVEELNLAEIAEIVGVTAARICQLKAAALKKVRERLQ